MKSMNDIWPCIGNSTVCKIDWKRYPAAAVFLLVASCIAAMAAAEAAPTIDRVIVFRDRAQVTRSTLVFCKRSGLEMTIAFHSLPGGIDTKTLRAELRGPAKLLGTLHKRSTLTEASNNSIRKLETEIHDLETRLQEKNDTITRLANRLSRLAAYEQYGLKLLNEEARNRKPNTVKWASFFKNSEKERLAATESESRLRSEIKRLSRKKSRLERILQDLVNGRSLESVDAEVAFRCKSPGKISVALGYVINGATWHPEYDVRFMASGKGKGLGKGKVELTVSAVIQQSTGEDWQDAKIVLSTATPRLGAEAPYPAPLFINGYKVEKAKVLVEAKENRQGLRGSAGYTQSSATSADVQEHGQSFTFSLPRRTTVKSDGRPYWIPVDELSTKAEAVLAAVPKMKPFVYKLVRLHNPASYPLLRGRMHVYSADSYMGDILLDRKAPGEPMEVSFGPDEELRIERFELKNKTRRPGAFSSTKKLERAYRIVLKSHATVPRTVEIMDNIPVSKTEDIKIGISRSKTTQGFSFDDHTGFVKWIVDIEPGKERHVDLYYTISLPEDWQVTIR